ncbi:MAG: hypothetical protein LBQ08_00895 [Holosporaceae bacterium]|jgi:hypothetical protein|nr:hypothetical protein [Holosporaceae bacterium]
MVRINKKRMNSDRGDRDITIDRNLVKADQLLEISTAKNVYIESVECSGIKIIAAKIFLRGDIISHGPIVLAATEICVNDRNASI